MSESKYKLYKNELPESYGYFWIRHERINGLTKIKMMDNWAIAYIGRYHYKRKFTLMINWINAGQQELNPMIELFNLSGFRLKNTRPSCSF